ncbi:MAG: flagellar basal body protein [Pseudomonadota bacterium]
MALSDLNFVGFLKTKMQWHQARQNILAQNVANANSPRYKPRDLKPLTFGQELRENALESVATQRTHRAHFQETTLEGRGAVPNSQGRDFEVTPAGNAVVLEDQMIKVSGNQFQFQMASELYSRSLGLIKTAIGRGR